MSEAKYETRYETRPGTIKSRHAAKARELTRGLGYELRAHVEPMLALALDYITARGMEETGRVADALQLVARYEHLASECYEERIRRKACALGELHKRGLQPSDLEFRAIYLHVDALRQKLEQPTKS